MSVHYVWLCGRIRELLHRRGRREAGQGMAEYALVLALVAIVVIVVVIALGRRTNNVYSNVANGLSQ